MMERIRFDVLDSAGNIIATVIDSVPIHRDVARFKEVVRVNASYFGVRVRETRL